MSPVALLRRIRYILRALFRRSALDREMRDEMQYHLEQRAEALMGSGMSRHEARLAARREFGNPTLHEEHGRDARGTGWIDSLRSDVRFAFRAFRRRPLSAATIVLVLAIGIGGNAFQLSLVRRAMSSPQGLPGDVPLVRLRAMQRAKDSPDWLPFGMSYPEVRNVANLRNAFAAVAAWTTRDVVAATTKSNDGERTTAYFVTDGYFPTVGVSIGHGPGLPTPGDRTPLVAVISDAMWQDAFARADVAGRAMTVNGLAARIVGVAPEHFTGALPLDRRRLIWMPLSARATILAASGASALALSSDDSVLFQAVGRLQPGVTPEQATVAVHTVVHRTAAQWTSRAGGPAATMVYGSDVVPLRGITAVGSDMPRIIAIWGVVTLLVLLMACANVSALVISAGVARRDEIAIRLSLGASRRRIVRQLVTESTLLALIGGASGLLIYRSILAALSQVRGLDFIRPDVVVVSLTMVVALVTGVLFGLTPALHATRVGLAEVLKGTATVTTHSSRLQHRFVVAQIALMQPLLMLFGSLTAELLVARPASLPASTMEHVLDLSLDAQSLAGTYPERVTVLQRLETQVSAVPGIVQVHPDMGFLRSATFSVSDEDRGGLARASAPIAADLLVVREGYFTFLDAPLLRGTDVVASDTLTPIIISSDLARELWGAADPIGRRLIQLSPPPDGYNIRRDVMVTGVYDARYLPRGESHARMYRPRHDWWNSELLIRTAVPAEHLAPEVRRAAHAILPAAPIEMPQTLAQIHVRVTTEQRLMRAGAFASVGLVLLLTSIGLYGVIALAVAQRRREIGVRMALGARSGQVVGLFQAEGMRLAVVGLALGLPLSLVGVHILNANLSTPPIDERVGVWALTGVIAAVVLAVASVATLLPASRAATVDPVGVLRE